MTAPPTIFSPRRRAAARRRMRVLQRGTEAPRYVIDDMDDDVIERLAFLRHAPARALVIGDWTGRVAETLARQDAAVVSADPVPGAGEESIDEEHPLELGQFDLAVSLGTLDTVNDLPGALVHLRHALAPGGLMIASFLGAGSLGRLREAMAAGDAERPAPRIHPQVDVRAGGMLLQRCGFARPVIDSRTLTVRFGSLDRLVADLRAQGLGSVLARPGPALTRAMRDRARAAFSAAGTEGRTEETFEILTLSGWKEA
ncbi:class I SAM-dependent methyltransferase [Novosphingobium tardum]|uniref:Class I SAM-dependent methyltransferase n=1 Tax=Novosphingobium tardum TaxID=1538021 RepID=A0ABV8RPD2_9SPHN